MKKDAKYTVNHWIYFILLVVFTFITAILLILLKKHLDDAHFVAIISAVISILGGGVPSVITAWLIDVANCKENNKRLLNLKSAVFSKLYFTASSFIMSFRIVNRDVAEKRHWTAWASRFIDSISGEEFKTKVEFISENIIAFEKEIDNLLERKELLISERILNSTESSGLLGVKNSLRCWEIELNETKPDKQRLIALVDDLKEQLDSCELLRPYFNVEYNEYGDLIN